MYESGNNPFHEYLAHNGYTPESAHSRHLNTAISQFKWSLFCGRISRLLRGAFQLYDLNVIRKSLGVCGVFHAGIRVVELEKIVGSEGRTGDFDRRFHPLCERERERWVSVATARLSHQSLPPVELIQVGEAYFVRDGHHRISVARAFGQMAIDAEVIVWNASPPFPWQKSPASSRIKPARKPVHLTRG